MVYRRKNVDIVTTLLAQLDDGIETRLWALDEVDDRLEGRTMGSGPGARFSLINHLYNSKPVSDGAWVVVADDDVYFLNGDLRTMIQVMKQTGFAFAQPGQSTLGWWTDMFSVSRPFVLARDTNFVDQGPLFLADPDFFQLMFPLPESDDMGWGVEAEWYRLNSGRSRMGIIDACRVVHCHKTASSYDIAPQVSKMNERLRECGVDSLWQLRSVNKYWFRWQSEPPWAVKT
jgi:hypothetical protein